MTTFSSEERRPRARKSANLQLRGVSTFSSVRPSCVHLVCVSLRASERAKDREKDCLWCSLDSREASHTRHTHTHTHTHTYTHAHTHTHLHTHKPHRGPDQRSANFRLRGVPTSKVDNLSPAIFRQKAMSSGNKYFSFSSVHENNFTNAPGRDLYVVIFLATFLKEKYLFPN